MRQLCFVPLEERILYDAAIAHDVTSAAPTSSAPVQVLLVPVTTPDFAAFMGSVKDGVYVVTYDPHTATLDSIRNDVTQAVGSNKIESLGIVGDGSSGVMKITDTQTLTFSSFNEGEVNSAMLQFWQGLGSLLQPNGHVDLISCQVGEGPLGQALISSLQNVLNSTGSDITVFASTNNTGSLSLGGDWVLESPTSLDVSQLYFQPVLLSQWNNLLPVVNDFSLQYSQTLNGDLILTSNSILQAPEGSIITSTSTNTDFSMIYSDIDSDSFTFNSSSAFLSVPEGSTITFAGLYWGGNLLSDHGDSSAENPTLANQILLKLPNAMGYTSIIGDQQSFYTFGGTLGSNDSAGNFYQGFADITSLVQGSGSGTYTVANLQVAPGVGSQGGWTLVMVYSNPTTPLHNVAVYDGLLAVNSNTGVTQSLSGFQTTSSGPVDAHVGFVAYDGDVSSNSTGAGDSLFINNQPLEDLLNPDNDLFNSRISVNGSDVLGLPLLTNHLGYDAKIIDASSLFTNNQTGADFLFTGTNDKFLTGVLTFSAKLHDASATPTLTFQDLTPTTPGIHVGDTVQYTIQVANTGDASAQNVVVNDIIPSHTTYLSGSLKINGVSLTDALDSDLAEFSSLTNEVIFHLGNLQPGASTTLTFSVLINIDTLNGTVVTNTATDTFFVGLPGNTHSQSDTVDFTVLSDTPIGTSPSYTTLEDSLLMVPSQTGLLQGATDTETSSNGLSAILVSGQGPQHGLLTLNPNGSFTYQPFLNFNGTDNFQFQVRDGSGLLSSVQTVVIQVTSVNDAPSFTAGADQIILEDSGAQTVAGWATNISPGPTNESNQTLNFLVTTDNPDLFSVQPSISANGTLSYATALNANGIATITVQLKDSGGILNGGVDTSGTQTFTILVNPVNDAPSFTVGANQTVAEDSGTHTVAGWASNISPGPSNESNQTLNFLVTNSNNSLFSVQPTIDSHGNLNYTLAPNVNGSATVTVRLHDSGGTANGGMDTSAPQTFTISTLSINDAPFFTAGANQTVLEDSGAHTVAGWATNIGPGPSNETNQTLEFLVINDNPSLFSVQPSISANGTLSYTTALNANGIATISVQLRDSGGTLNGGIDTSGAQTFMITVNPVNDAPSFTSGDNQTVAEDSGAHTVSEWASNISSGPINESNQDLNFVVTNNNPGLFTIQPTMTADGTLTYSLAPDAYGLATVSVKIQDNGGTANGGVNTSIQKVFTINVLPINDAPTITLGSNQFTSEDSGSQVISGWATNISPGPKEADQALQFIVSTDNPSLFSVQPSVDANGTLTYTPALNANGMATVFVQLQDNGGSERGGVNATPVEAFSINVASVNDVPTFNLGPNEQVLGDSGIHTIPNWALNISPGPADEAGQTVQFIVSNSNPGLFSVQPFIDAQGNLNFTLLPGMQGVTNVTVQLQDSAGALGAPQTFTITVTSPVATPPSIITESHSVPVAVPSEYARILSLHYGLPAEGSQEMNKAPLPSTSGQGLTYNPDSSNLNFMKPYLPLPEETYNMNLIGIATTETRYFEKAESGTGSVESHLGELDQLNHPLFAVAAIASASVLADPALLDKQRRWMFILSFNWSGIKIEQMDPTKAPVTWMGEDLSFEVSLKSAPLAKVIVQFETSNPELARVVPARLEFGDSDWNIPKQITVVGKGGKGGELTESGLVGGEEYQLKLLPLESSDHSYEELTINPITLWAIDPPQETKS